MAAWNPSLGWVSYRDTTKAISVLLHIIRATISGQSRLTSSQSDAILAWGQQELTRVAEWLRGLEWTGLHKGCVLYCTDAAEVLAFPHLASYCLTKLITKPLIALCSMPGGRALVSGELVSTIELAWSAVQRAYPDRVDASIGFVWSSGLDRIDSQLAELKAVVGQRSL